MHEELRQDRSQKNYLKIQALLLVCMDKEEYEDGLWKSFCFPQAKEVWKFMIDGKLIRQIELCQD
jgi:hypothetical protein